MNTKILITVRGGTVQEVATSNDAQIVIIDYDNVAEGQGGKPVSEIMEPDNVCPVFWEIYNDETDPQEMEIKDELKRLKF